VLDVHVDQAAVLRALLDHVETLDRVERIEPVTPSSSITIEPISVYFANENKAMGLRPHQHFAEVTLTFATHEALGFPVFGETVGALAGVLRASTERPFRDSTNEDVADALFETINALLEDEAPPTPEIIPTWATARAALARWGGEYSLQALELAVRGVPDDIGHSDGFARYTVTA
jgi:hypothetical protein